MPLLVETLVYIQHLNYWTVVLSKPLTILQCNLFYELFRHYRILCFYIIFLHEKLLELQSVPNTTNDVSLNPPQARCTLHNIM